MKGWTGRKLAGDENESKKGEGIFMLIIPCFL
jgi:hypothetical protein